MRRGLTLLEVLLATAILGFALLTLVGVFSSGLKLARQSREATAATSLARSCLERIRDLGFDRLPPGNLSFTGQPATGPFPPLPYPRQEVDGHLYTVNVTLTEAGLYLKEVRVQVGWGQGSLLLATRVAP